MVQERAAQSSQLDVDAPWVEKYRPKTLDDVAAHTDIIDTIKRLVSENKLPHLLLYGPPGTGKTSTILAVARQIYGPSFSNMTLELNASDDRGIGVVRQQVQDFASTQTLFSNKFKLIILDECDAMTKDAQFALRRGGAPRTASEAFDTHDHSMFVIEKYTRNARFCLICNYVSKIIPALQSRCTRFRFPPLPESNVRERLSFVAHQEGIHLDEEGMQSLITLGAGDMRRTLNIFQATAMSSPAVSQEAVYQCTGNPLPSDIERCFRWLMNETIADAYSRLQQLQLDKGLALVDIIQQLHLWVFEVKMPDPVRIELISKMADVEYRLAFAVSERLQLGSLVGAFAEAKEGLVKAAA